MKQLRVLDLFSGIGGFSLGLERAGMTTVAFCEIDPFCRKVLAKHWPKVPCYDDVRTLTVDRLRADGITIDLICGGFPCQDISVAGKGAGIEGERSGLWSEYARIIGEIRPRFVIVENVAALLGRGLSRVLGDLAALGYDAEWHCIPASTVGAPHRRDRLWIIAHPSSSRRWSREPDLHARKPNVARSRKVVANAAGIGLEGTEQVAVAVGKRLGDARDVDNTNGSGGKARKPTASPMGHRNSASPTGSNVDDANQSRLEGRRRAELRECADEWVVGPSGAFSDTESNRRSPEGEWSAPRYADGLHELRQQWSTHWLVEPGMGRLANGIPRRMDRLRSLGNAVVPQIPEIIGKAIMRHEAVEIQRRVG